MTNDLGSRIRAAREARGIHASGLAKLVGVTPTAVWNWEKNGVQPRQDVLSTLAKVLGVSTEHLTAGAVGNEVGGIRGVPEIIEQATSEIANSTGMPRERVKIHVEFLPA